MDFSFRHMIISFPNPSSRHILGRARAVSRQAAHTQRMIFSLTHKRHRSAGSLHTKPASQLTAHPRLQRLSWLSWYTDSWQNHSNDCGVLTLSALHAKIPDQNSSWLLRGRLSSLKSQAASAAANKSHCWAPPAPIDTGDQGEMRTPEEVIQNATGCHGSCLSALSIRR